VSVTCIVISVVKAILFFLFAGVKFFFSFVLGLFRGRGFLQIFLLEVNLNINYFFQRLIFFFFFLLAGVKFYLSLIFIFHNLG